MYSVLIQNQKTIELFQEFHPLFMEAINRDQIGVCRWMEPGTTVDTALPELKELIEDKEEWRAIIVRVVDEDDMGQYGYDPRNPFDFKYYHEAKREYAESPIPLVRLTNMLGEIPAPEIKYEAVEILEDNKSPRLVYQPRKSDEEEAVYQDLLEKYDFDGKNPSEIILISVRKRMKAKKERIEQAWTNYNEIESSNFWKINPYAKSCRFIVYDMKHQGSTELDADMFKFWTCVLHIAQNHVEPDELQAYRLYHMNVKLNKGVLQNSIQKRANRLRGISILMTQHIQAEDSKWRLEHKKLPNYRMEVPVVLDLPRHHNLSVDHGMFPTLTNNVENDMRRWNELSRESEQRLKETAGRAEVALDEAAEMMRDFRSMREQEVLQLNKYQRKMMDVDLRGLYSLFLDSQKQLPDSKKAVNDHLKESSQDVRKSLMLRITSKQIINLVWIIVLLIAMVIVPGIIVYYTRDTGNLRSIISALFVLIDLFVLPVLILVILQKREMTDKIRTYNLALGAAVGKIAESSELYSNFLGSMVSHSRGQSYLQILRNKKFALSNTRITIDTHMKAIDAMMYTLEKWNKAFYLNANFNQSFYDEDDGFEMGIPPMKNRLYTLEYGHSHEIPLNNSGAKVQSPFDFVERIELTREELYD